MPTALIVDDEPEANRLLSMLVTLRGYKVASAYTGEEALDRIGREPPDVVLLDLMLPDINGYEVCEAIKARKATTLIPVVMVTARVAGENRIRSYTKGADHYVAKPYTPDEIFEALDDAEHWRERVQSHPAAISGEIKLDPRCEEETLRKLARLRSLLFAKTPLDLGDIRELDETLKRLIDDAACRGTSQANAPVATLNYALTPESVDLAFHDLSGWTRDDPRSFSERWPVLLSPSRFDEIQENRERGTLSLSKRRKNS